MLMKHDQSVQRVVAPVKIRMRNQSVGGQTTQQNVHKQRMFYPQNTFQNDNSKNQSPNYQSKFLNDQHAMNTMYQTFAMSKQYRNLDLSYFTPDQLQINSMTPFQGRSSNQSLGPQKMTNQDLQRQMYYGNLITNVSTRNLQHPQLANQSSNNFHITSQNMSNQLINQQSTQSELNEQSTVKEGSSTKQITIQQHQNDLPNLTNTYKMFKDVQRNEDRELAYILNQQKYESLRIKYQQTLKREKQKVEQIKRHKQTISIQTSQIAQKQQQLQIQQFKIEPELKNQMMRFEDQNQIDLKKKSKSPLEIKEIVERLSKKNKKSYKSIPQCDIPYYDEVPVHKVSSKSQVDPKKNIMAFKIKDTKSIKSIEDVKSKKSEKIQNKSKNSIDNSPKKQDLNSIKSGVKSVSSSQKPKNIIIEQSKANIKDNQTQKAGITNENEQDPMNQTFTQFSSNIVQETNATLQTKTPNIVMNKTVSVQMKKSIENNNDSNEQEIQKRSSFFSQKSKLQVSSNIQSQFPSSKKETSNVINNPIKEEKQRSSKQKDGNKLDTTDNYEDYNESEDTIQKKQRPEVNDQQSEDSSKMMDSHAQNSDDSNYDSDQFDEEKPQKNQNASEYFKELEAKKQGDTPVGGNSNADGGSMFNQTGGRFMSRTGMNQTKSSLHHKQNEDVGEKSPIKASKNGSLTQNQSQFDSNIKKRQSQASSTLFNNSQKQMGNRDSQKRYQEYQESKEGKIEFKPGQFSTSPPSGTFLMEKKQNQTKLEKIQKIKNDQTRVSKGSNEDLVDVGIRKSTSNKLIKKFNAEVKSQQKSNNEKAPISQQIGVARYSNNDEEDKSEEDKSEQYTDEEDYSDDQDHVQDQPKQPPTRRGKPDIGINEPDEDYSDDEDQIKSIKSLLGNQQRQLAPSTGNLENDGIHAFPQKDVTPNILQNKKQMNVQSDEESSDQAYSNEAFD